MSSGGQELRLSLSLPGPPCPSVKARDPVGAQKKFVEHMKANLREEQRLRPLGAPDHRSDGEGLMP